MTYKPPVPVIVPTATVPQNGKGDGQLCACGAGQHPNDSERCARGHALVNNGLARTTGEYARQHPADVVERADALLEGLVADLGGEDEMTALERAAASKLRAVEILFENNIRVFVAEAPGSKLGQRAHDNALSAIDRFVRLAGLLGTKRRARQVGNLAEQFAALHVAEARR
jgi:hypothetical protein